MPVVVGGASRPAVGEMVCGDAYAIVPMAHGTLVCLADGLGHGPAAKEAADAVCAHVREHAAAPLDVLLQGADRALAGSRGAAVSLLAIEPANGRVLFAGVGNVELYAVTRVHVASPTRPGIVGRGLHGVRVWEHALSEGDLFALASDGIAATFELEPFAHLAPQAIADALVEGFHKKHDDASCVVARLTTEATAAGTRR
jgi:serine/threonine protein phosphatase PrpC